MTYGTSEARLAEILASFEADLPENIKLAYLPSSGINKLRLTGTGDNHKLISDKIEDQVRKLYSIIPDLIYGENELSLEMVVGQYLREKKKTLCSAESCTGGNIAHMITSVPHSSDYFKGSIVAYANSIKTELLGISGKVIDREGAVSEPVVRAMAEGARRIMKTDYSVATSGIAGPDGGTEDKPVGTIWIAVASGSETVSEKHTFGTDRLYNIKRFSLVALNLLRKQIIKV